MNSKETIPNNKKKCKHKWKKLTIIKAVDSKGNKITHHCNICGVLGIKTK
jgi:hypothetical protein